MLTNPARRLVLASASPRRSRILSNAGYDIVIRPTNAAEVSIPLDPAYTVAKNAIIKLDACRVTCPDDDIIAADTLVWFRGKLIGKPKNLSEAADFLREFSGNPQTVFTGVACSHPDDSKPYVRIENSVVVFKTLSEALIQEYIDLVHPLDRAGAYDIIDYGEMIIDEVIGSKSNVAGLPIDAVRDWLNKPEHRT